MKKIKRALISVADKTGLLDLAKVLQQNNVEILASDGSAAFLSENGFESIKISDYTGFPEILGGRVKTLNPLIFGGILAKRNDEEHLAQLDQVNAKLIDLVIIDLYHFYENPSVEKIDIGGSALLRAAAKNFNDMAVIIDNNDYTPLIEEISKNGGTTLEFRKKLAEKAFRFNAYYDGMVSDWLSGENHKDYLGGINTALGTNFIPMRYGENPGQKAIFQNFYEHDKLGFTQLSGKELSYNNILDAHAAIHLCYEFLEKACLVIVKHNNPCCVAIADTVFEAYNKAIQTDKESSFGGIVACNNEVDTETAKEIIKIFTELVIAPAISAEALEIFKTKPNLRVLTFKNIADISNKFDFKPGLGGLLIQESNYSINQDNWRCVTKIKPTKEESQDAEFAYKVSKHVKSNAIIFVKNGVAVAIGPGQTSRVQSTRIAMDRLKSQDKQYDELVMASDGFLPFADSLEIAIEAKVGLVIQPGGSIRDQEVINKADENGIKMIFTGQRVFKH